MCNLCVAIFSSKCRGTVKLPSLARKKDKERETCRRRFKSRETTWFLGYVDISRPNFLPEYICSQRDLVFSFFLLPSERCKGVSSANVFGTINIYIPSSFPFPCCCHRRNYPRSPLKGHSVESLLYFPLLPSREDLDAPGWPLSSTSYVDPEENSSARKLPDYARLPPAKMPNTHVLRIFPSRFDIWFIVAQKSNRHFPILHARKRERERSFYGTRVDASLLFSTSIFSRLYKFQRDFSKNCLLK